MRNAAYIRVSSDKQDVSRQKTSCVSCATKLGLTINRWFEDSDGKNPRHRSAKRKDFQRLLTAVRSGEIDTIIVDSQDRFGTKDAFEWSTFVGLLREHSCELYDSNCRKLSADDDGAVLTGVVGALTSKREQREKAHRNISGKVKHAKKGEYQGGYPPYGFDVVCFGPDGKEKWRSLYVGHFDRWKVYPNGKREHFKGKNVTPAKDTTDTLRLRPSIESDRLKTVKQVFKWYTTEDISPRHIAERLNETQISPVFGEAWYKQTVKAMLQNPIYLGIPTWNKRAGSEFVEYVNGEFREVASNQKAGRRRVPADFIQPDKPEFMPVIDQKTFATAQRKLDEYSKKSNKPREAPHAAELWLRPFLFCGHCDKPMHATAGRSTRGMYPSYFCGTYNKFGAKNPTGCHCHRVKHEVIEQTVELYLKQTAPKIAKLLKATDTGDIEEIKPILENVNGAAGAFSGVACEILAFVEDHANEGELAKLIKQGKGFTGSYGILFERVRPRLEKQLIDKQAEIDKMLDDFTDLPDRLRHRAIERMQPLQDEIDDLGLQLKDWRGPYANLRQQLDARQEGMTRAQKTIRKEGAERQKADALRGVIDRIVCHFHHTKKASKSGEHNGKSILDRVEIFPVSGGKVCFSAEPPPEQD
jgi:DNA invertase Pin-like site-specific DNA recombinase